MFKPIVSLQLAFSISHLLSSLCQYLVYLQHVIIVALKLEDNVRTSLILDLVGLGTYRGIEVRDG